MVKNTEEPASAAAVCDLDLGYNRYVTGGGKKRKAKK